MIRKGLLRVSVIVAFFLVPLFFVQESPSKSLREDEQLIHVGVGAFQDGIYDIAEKQFSLFLRNFPAHGKVNEVSYLLGRTLLYERKWKEASIAFSRIALENRNFESTDYALFWLAQTEIKLGNLEGSRKWLLLLLKNYPRFEWIDCAYFLLGCLDAEANRWKLSEGSFRKILALSKREDLLQSAAFWLGMAFLKRNDFEAAAPYLNSLLRDSSSYSKDAFFWLGETEFGMGRYQEAKQNYETFYNRFKGEPLSPQAFWRIGFCDYRSGNFKEAVDRFKTFESQFERSPLLPYTYYLLGEIFLNQGDHASSLKALNRVLQAPELHFLEGTALLLLHWNYLLSDEREEAHRIHQRMSKLNVAEEEKSFIQWMTAETLFAEGRIADALPYYFSILNSKFRENALFQIGKGYFLEHQFREALTNLDLLILESPNSRSLEESLLIKGEALHWLGDFPRAFETYGQIVSLSKKSPWALMALTQVGLRSIALGEKERAEDAFMRIVRDFPNHSLSYHAAFQLGNLYGEKKDLPQAARAYTLALKGPISELVAPIHFRIGEALIQDGKEAKALSSFKEALRSAASGSIWFSITELEIGNLERREGRSKEAKRSYRAAYDQSKDPEVKKAAARLLERLESQ